LEKKTIAMPESLAQPKTIRSELQAGSLLIVRRSPMTAIQLVLRQGRSITGFPSAEIVMPSKHWNSVSLFEAIGPPSPGCAPSENRSFSPFKTVTAVSGRNVCR
jgi:hypothetical protein